MVCVQYKLFYAPEPVDKLSRILGSWKPGLFPRSYLADIVDLTHTQLLLLESNTKAVHQAEEVRHEEAAARPGCGPDVGGRGGLMVGVPR